MTALIFDMQCMRTGCTASSCRRIVAGADGARWFYCSDTCMFAAKPELFGFVARVTPEASTESPALSADDHQVEAAARAIFRTVHERAPMSWRELASLDFYRRQARNALTAALRARRAA